MQIVHGCKATFIPSVCSIGSTHLKFWRYKHDAVGDSFLLAARTAQEAKGLFYGVMEFIRRRYKGYPKITRETDDRPVVIRSGRIRFGKFDVTPACLGFQKPGVLFDPDCLFTLLGQPVSEHLFGEE